MIDHESIALAVRNRLLTLSVCATGSISLSVTATGYARAAGSFVTDRFAPGMELVAAGFTNAGNNGRAIVTGVTPTALNVTKIAGPLVVESAGTRTLTVGMPATRAWENLHLDPQAGQPYVEEDYLPGGAPVLLTIGPSGRIEGKPLYVLRLYGPANTGPEALKRYAAAVLNLFPPKQPIVLSNGDPLRVREDLNPFPGQLQQAQPGWAAIAVTLPLRVESTNSF